MNITSSRSDVAAHTVTRYHAKTEWYVMADKDETYVCYTGWVTCAHDHLDIAAADKCLGRLRWRVEHRPELFPQIVQAMDAARKKEDEG